MRETRQTPPAATRAKADASTNPSRDRRWTSESVTALLRARRHSLAVKRLVDILVAALSLILLVPILGLIALAILVDSGRPILFRTERIGRGGRHFTMYKFRTMVPDAAAQLPKLQHLNLAEGMVKIPNDPRVTRVGRWLRRLSLDELPQLWNVIRGDMSLIGPRPHDPREVQQPDGVFYVRFAMRPGLTGLWQVHARNDPSLSVRVHYDLRYVAEWSLLFDLWIAWKTVPVVLRGQGGQVQVPAVLQTAAEE